MAHQSFFGLLGLGLGLGSAQGAADLKPPSPHVEIQSNPGLLISPTRLIFDKRKRTAELMLSNSGNATNRYRISLQRMEMDEEGQIKEVPVDTSEGQVALLELLRFSPRRVVLEPHEIQTVRVQLRKPADLPPGEYRLYLAFQEEPPVTQAAAPGAGQEEHLALKLTAIMKMAIPVIIREGATSARVALTGLTLDQDGKQLHFRMERTGNQSVYGDLAATFQPRSGKPKELARVNGVAVYSPNPLRKFTMNLAAPAASLGEGRLELTYVTPPDQAQIQLASAALDLPARK